MFNKIIYIIVPILMLIFLGLVFFSSAGRDDAYITYWSAYSLSNYGKILNYNGNNIEQSSSLLHVVLLSLINKITRIRIVSLGYITSILFGIFSLIAVFKLSNNIIQGSGFLTALFLCSFSYFIYWSYSGLETTLVSFITVLLVISYGYYMNNNNSRSLIYVIISTLFFDLVRPEAIFVVFCLIIGSFILIFIFKEFNFQIKNNIFYNKLLKLLIINFLLAISIFIFRKFYFNAFFPQPVSVKSGKISLDSIKFGLYYLQSHLFGSFYLTILSFLIFISIIYITWTIWKNFLKYGNLNFYFIFSLLTLFTYMSFIVLSKGDWMEGGRFLVHILPIYIMFLGLFINLIHIRLKKYFSILILIVILAFQIIILFNFTSNHSTGIPLWISRHYYKSFGTNYNSQKYNWFERTNRVHMRDIPTIFFLDNIIEKILNHKDEVNILTGQMGMIPYYITKKYNKKVKYTDLRGLTDKKLSDCIISKKIPRTHYGLPFWYLSFLQNQNVFINICQIKSPDLIFDLGKEEIVKKYSSNYSIAYTQKGKLKVPSKRFSGTNLSANQFIAIKKNLIRHFKKDKFKKNNVDFRIILNLSHKK